MIRGGGGVDVVKRKRGIERKGLYPHISLLILEFLIFDVIYNTLCMC